MKQIPITFTKAAMRRIEAGEQTLTSRLDGLKKLNNGYYRDRINKVRCHEGLWCFYEDRHGSSALPVFMARCPYGEHNDLLIAGPKLILEVQRVWPSQLHDMTWEMIDEEGCPSGMFDDYFEKYGKLWDRLYAKRGYPWALNPWVWRIEFVHTSSSIGEALRNRSYLTTTRSKSTNES